MDSQYLNLFMLFYLNWLKLNLSLPMWRRAVSATRFPEIWSNLPKLTGSDEPLQVTQVGKTFGDIQNLLDPVSRVSYLRTEKSSIELSD